MNVTGTWKGEYAFEETDEGGGKHVAGTIVTFTMTLKQGWLGGFSGTVQDDARSGFAEQGSIKGKLSGKVMSFEKQMPVLRLIHERSRLSLEQWAERKKVVMNTTIPHPKIRYLGDISEDGNTVEGTWMVSEYTLDVPGSYEKLMMPTLAGTWKMTRAQ